VPKARKAQAAIVVASKPLMPLSAPRTTRAAARQNCLSANAGPSKAVPTTPRPPGWGAVGMAPLPRGKLAVAPTPGMQALQTVGLRPGCKATVVKGYRVYLAGAQLTSLHKADVACFPVLGRFVCRVGFGQGVEATDRIRGSAWTLPPMDVPTGQGASSDAQQHAIGRVLALRGSQALLLKADRHDTNTECRVHPACACMLPRNLKTWFHIGIACRLRCPFVQKSTPANQAMVKYWARSYFQTSVL
jgi:hypothetical protein